MTDASVVRHYDAHGMRLVATAHTPAHMVGLDLLLSRFATEPTPNTDAFTLHIRSGRPDQTAPLDERLRETWSGRLGNGAEATTYALGDLHVMDVPGQTRLRADYASGQGELIVASDALCRADAGCIPLLLLELFARAGQFRTHAATLATAANRAIVLAGPSGRGKTTAALALTQHGMRLMSDDTCLICPDAATDAVTVWGLPRYCKVHVDTVGLLPWLADLPSQPDTIDPNERRIDLADLPSADPRHLRRPAMVLLLDERNDRDHRITPVDPLTAVTALVRENVRAGDTRAEGVAGQTFAALTAMVRQCRCYLLSVGPDLGSLGEKIAAIEGDRRSQPR